jgi:hypothetical protein
MWRRVAFVRTDASEERIASIISVERISELGTLAVTSNWSTLRRNTSRFWQEPHGVTSQKMAFYIVSAVNISNLTQSNQFGLYFYVIQHTKLL